MIKGTGVAKLAPHSKLLKGCWMSTMEAEQQKLNYPKCVCGCVCGCACSSVCSLPRFSTDDVISYLYLFLNEHYIIDTSGWQWGRDAQPPLTLEASLELNQQRQPENLLVYQSATYAVSQWFPKWGSGSVKGPWEDFRRSMKMTVGEIDPKMLIEILKTA